MGDSLGSIFRNLDLSVDNGLAIDTQQELTVYQRQFYLQVKEKLNIDAVYFLRDSEGVPKTPLIYFSCMDSYDADKIAQLHRLSWNTGEAPLLFIVLPDQLLVFNNYVTPKQKDGKLDPTKGLIEIISLVNDLEQQRQLQKYNRLQLETGKYWRDNAARFNILNRIDTTLINNLKIMRKRLMQLISGRCTDTISSKEVATIVHGILGRSILIKYLEERKDSLDNSVFPTGFYNAFKPGAQSYSDILTDKDVTYALYDELEKHFHGDIFPLAEHEKEVVTSSDLNELKQFLDGDIDLNNNQLALWPLYSFNVIPIQLISSIYEMFFHLQESDSENGTYYTPFHLVEMLTDEVFPWETPYKDIKVLDPACGSGIFLVEAYRRMIGQWMHSQKTRSIKSEQLIHLLVSNIFGVDSNEEAIRIASFSLCLTMCDFLEPRSIWEELEFPSLKGNNLFPADFFTDGEKFEQQQYDIIIGNPPWESQLSEEANGYITNTKHPIGDKQIAQAFSWKAADLSSADGVVCFLMPSKGFLFNRSNTNAAYRKEFFSRFEVSVLVNFSAFRKVLFEHASGPATGVVYYPKRKASFGAIFYCTPKPLYTIEDRRRFFIEPIDICRIPRDMIENDLIWKIAMWGGPRDLDLVTKMLSINETIDGIIIKESMQKAEGFKRGNQKKSCAELLTMPMVWAKSVTPYGIDRNELEFLREDGFECTVERSREVFLAPHLLIKQSPVKWRFRAAFLEFNAVFNHSILGISGKEDMLKYLCLIINSKVFSYYQIMTSRRWMVERDELEASEILAMPVPYPSTEVLQKAVEVYDLIIKTGPSIEPQIDDFVYQQYRLTAYEIEIIQDALNYVYDSFCVKGKSHAFIPTDHNQLKLYSEVICNTLNNSLNTSAKIECWIYHSDAPLTVARIDFNSNNQIQKENSLTDQKVDELLADLDKLLIEQRSQSVFIRRNVRIYNKDEVYVVKPNQQKYWTYSAACRDADEIYADVMRAWRLQHE